MKASKEQDSEQQMNEHTEQTEPETEEISNPIVFQCDKCHTIIGDSFAFSGSDDELKTITLEASTNLNQSELPKASFTGRDIGSAFYELSCSSCKTILGRKYITTARHMDHMRDMYTLDTSSISSYQLGSGITKNNDKTLGLLANPAMQQQQETLESLKKDMTKIQNLFLVFDERLSDMENSAIKRKRL